MKQLLTFLVLFSHMNFTMFIPQLYETDHISVAGKQEDDINTLYEFIDQVVLTHQDVSPEDEDDDQEKSFYLFEMDEYAISRFAIIIKKPFLEINTESTYCSFIIAGLPAVSFDIQSPPPDVLTIA